jgi:TonB family protein
LIHFDFDDRYADEAAVGSAISRREGVLLSIVTHVVVIGLIMLAGRLAWFQTSAEELERRRQELAERERETRPPRFVFVEPLVDRPAPPKLQADLSDQDRRAAAPERAPTPDPLPLSRGNSPEMTQTPESQQARGPEAPTPPAPDPTPPAPAQPEETFRLPERDMGMRRPSREVPRAASGALGDALRNLDRYVQNQTFRNPQGGATDPGTAIQFDTKGVEFGPWIRRFVAQVRRNWFVPEAAWAFHGRVVVQFNIHRSGRITDLVVVQPSQIDAFNRASFNAILGSNPTEPLPPEYPDDKAFFTVTFSYNEPLN